MSATTLPPAPSGADTRLDRAIALARKLAQDPRAVGTYITVACVWESGKPNMLHGRLAAHAMIGSPAARWLEEVLPCAPHRAPCEHWYGEVEGVPFGVYLESVAVTNALTSVLAQEAAPCAPAA